MGRSRQLSALSFTSVRDCRFDKLSCGIGFTGFFDVILHLSKHLRYVDGALMLVLRGILGQSPRFFRRHQRGNGNANGNGNIGMIWYGIPIPYDMVYLYHIMVCNALHTRPYQTIPYHTCCGCLLKHGTNNGTAGADCRYGGAGAGGWCC